ncbi:protein YthA, partial [Escherichia coli]
ILAVPFMIKTSLKTNLIFFFLCVFVPHMAS